MESKLPVTVCIPVRNGGRDLAECLESLQGEFAEVVVVDSQSTDGGSEGCEGREYRCWQPCDDSGEEMSFR